MQRKKSRRAPSNPTHSFIAQRQVTKWLPLNGQQVPVMEAPIYATVVPQPPEPTDLASYCAGLSQRDWRHTGPTSREGRTIMARQEAALSRPYSETEETNLAIVRDTARRRA
jgi:hypothetical protein